MFLLISLAIILILPIYFYFIRNFNYWKYKGVPYIKPKLFFGNLLDIVLGKEHVGKYVGKFYREFDSPYFGFFAFNRPYLVLTDPEIIKRVLIRDFHMFSNRYFPCDEAIDPIMSNGLFASRDSLWRWLRTKMSPFFTVNKIKLMVPLMKECNNNLRNYIEMSLGKNVEAKEMAAKFTTDVIATCAFGITANSFAKGNNGFRWAGRTMLSGSLSRTIQVLSYYYAPFLVKLFKFKFIEISAANFLRKVFMETITQREITKIKRNDLIDILIELKVQESGDEEFRLYGDRLVAQAITFFSAGYETSASTIAFTLHELCVNQEIQDRLRKEVNDVIKEHGYLTYHALSDMKYLHMIVSETLRKYPPTSFVHRECIQEYKLPETGLIIDQGTPIIIAQHGLHWNEKYFPNPEKFDPERFSEINKHKIIPCSYLPFGDGPRNCIGELIGLITSKMGIAEIIRNFQVIKNDQTREPIIFTPFPILQAKGGIPVTFRRL